MNEIDFTTQRVRMVDGQVRTTDVTDGALLDAMLSVPREAFVPEEMRPLAYIDEDLALGGGRCLMEPSPFARLAQLANIKPGERVLDVGAATGYASAVFSRLAGEVVALESDRALAAKAAAALAALGCGNIQLVEGELQAGWPKRAPYDVIFLGGAVEFVPPALLAQLAEGGRLVAVEGRGNAAMARLHIKEEGTVRSRRAFNAAVRPLPGFERVPAFSF